MTGRVPFLCGGVLFFLVVQSKLSGSGRRASVKDSHTSPEIMTALLQAVAEVTMEPSTIAKDTSNFRECLIPGSVNIPFDDKVTCDRYDDEVRNRYPKAVMRMAEFAKQHIEPVKSEWLVRAILEIIEMDKEIPDTDLFYLKPDGCPVPKAEITTMTDFTFPAVLVGVMHYILTHRLKDNCLGVETLNAIGEKTRKRERKYTGDLGAKIRRSIKVKFDLVDIRACEDGEDTVESTEKGDKQNTSPTSAVNEEFEEASYATADALQCVPTRSISSTIDKTDEVPLAESSNEEIQPTKDMALMEQFKEQADVILRYCIENDPTAEATRADLADEIQDFCQTWDYDLRKIEDAASRRLVMDVRKTLDEYSLYLGPDFLRAIPETEVLWFRNESEEENEQLRTVLRPETYRLRCELARLYRMMYPILEDEETEGEENKVPQKKR